MSRYSLRYLLFSIIGGFLLIITVSLIFNQLVLQDRTTHKEVLTAYKLRSNAEKIVIEISSAGGISPDLLAPVEEINLLIQQLSEFGVSPVSSLGDFLVHPAIINDNYRPDLAAISTSWSEFLTSWNKLSKLSPSDADYPAVRRKVTDTESSFLTRVKDFSESLESIEVKQEQNQSKQQFIYLGLGFILLVWGTYVIIFRVIRPISYLDGAARRMGQGDLTQPVRVETGGELGRLSRSFDHMRVEIDASQKNLEARVDERTNILTEAFEFSQEIVSQPDFSHLIDSAAQRIRKSMHAKSANICLLTQDMKRLELASQSEQATPAGGRNLLLQSQLPEDILEEVQNAATEIETICEKHQLQNTDDSLLAPLLLNDRNIGSICVIRDKSLPFTDIEKLTLKLLANATAVAIANIRLTIAVRRQDELNAIYNERHRLTSELHDETAQTLSLLNLKTCQLDDLLCAGEKEAASAEIEQCKQLIELAQAQMRMAFSDIHLSTELKNNGISRELNDLVEDFRNSSGIPVNLEISDLSSLTIPALIQKQAMYIVSEALTNVRRYADARNVRVVLENEGEGIRLVVSDDGKGFDPDLSRSDHHFGLPVMQARAERVGGMLLIETAPGAGTRITAHIPIMTVGPVDLEVRE
jgi:two-component system nitrate/nitrite sensor histidine kinase NarX